MHFNSNKIKIPKLLCNLSLLYNLTSTTIIFFPFDMTSQRAYHIYHFFFLEKTKINMMKPTMPHDFFFSNHALPIFLSLTSGELTCHIIFFPSFFILTFDIF